MLESEGYLILAECNVGAVHEDILLDGIRVAQVADIAFVDRGLESAQVEVVAEREQHVWPAHLDTKNGKKHETSKIKLLGSLASSHSLSICRSLTLSDRMQQSFGRLGFEGREGER